jgi:tetratricopeptide (TPR) repeat protein
MTRGRSAPIPLVLLLVITCSAEPSGQQPGSDRARPGEGVGPEAMDLHNRGFAALENEQPVEAEASYAELAERLPGDPLPWANLAVARLRQQETEGALEAVAKGLTAAPEGGETAGHLHALRGAILDWAGKPEEALDSYRRAAELAPRDPEVLYALYRQASSLGKAEAGSGALARLAEVRPDNFVILVERGKQAIQRGDRQAATAVYLRVRELLWQAPPMAETALQGVFEALESGETESARVPAARLENVLKITPMYRESLRELSPGIQGVPLRSFASEAPAAGFGDPLPVRFEGERLSESPTLGAALALADFDGDGRPDVARILDRPPGQGGPGLELRLSGGGERPVLPAPAAAGLMAVDLWNDGATDLVAFGSEPAVVWNGTRAEAGVELARMEEAATGLAGAPSGPAAAVLDYDLEGDLDLVLAGVPPSAGAPVLELYRNSLAGPLEPVGDRVFSGLELPAGIHAVVASDLDRDGDPDLVIAGDFGLRLLDNLRLGELADRTAGSGLEGAPPLRVLVAADLDNDGLPDLAAVGPGGLVLWRNGAGGVSGRFEPWGDEGLPDPKETGGLAALVAADFDNDGRLDLAAAGPEGVIVLGQMPEGGFRSLPVEGGPRRRRLWPPPTSTATATSTSWPPAPKGSTGWSTRAATPTTGCGCASRA